MNKEQLNEIFKDVDINKKKIIESMYDDFIYEHEMIEKLKPQIRILENPKNQKEADKLKFFNKIYSDISQRHDSKIKIFLSTLNKEEGKGDSPLARLLKEYE